MNLFKSIMTTGAILAGTVLIPSISLASGTCDTGYPNMYVLVSITNYASAVACYTDSGTNTVSGSIVCYNTVNSGGIPTKATQIGTLNFSHQCQTHLHHANGGSCGGGYYDNSTTVTNQPADNWNAQWNTSPPINGTENPSSMNASFDYQ